MHFGRFRWLPLKILWTIFGLIPLALLVTGLVMYWQRVLGPWYRRTVAERSRPHMQQRPRTSDAEVVYNSRST